MSQKVFALSFAIFTLPIAFILFLFGLSLLHHQLYGFAPALILIAIAMGVSGISSARNAYKVQTTPFASWLGNKYRRALWACDFKHARRWNALCRRNAAKTTNKPTLIPAALFFIIGMVFILPSVFVVSLH